MLKVRGVLVDDVGKFKDSHDSNAREVKCDPKKEGQYEGGFCEKLEDCLHAFRSVGVEIKAKSSSEGYKT